MGGPTTASVQTNLDNKTIPLQVPISECIYENSAKNYECSPNDPGKETRIPFSLLPVVVVPIQTKKRVVYLRALLDTGSTASFITVSALSRIPSVLIESDIPLTMCTIQGMSREPSAKLRVNLKVKEGGLPVDCYKVPRIMQIGGGFDLDGPTLKALEKFPLNEPVSARGGQLDLLIGVPVLWKIVRGIFARVSDSLVLLDTIFGNVICGSASCVGQTVEARVATVEDLNNRIERLWQLDSFPRDDSESKLTMDEIAAVESMKKNLKFDKKTGRFQTRLLWKGKPDLVNNYAAAKAKLDGLMRRLCKDPNVKAAYKSVISEFIDQATVELVTWETLAQMKESSRVDLYFLPHRAVYDPGRVSTKCRVVMDASAKTATGKSLNDCLLPGPPLQQQIAAVELRFRKRKVALIGDCKKMFLQVLVHPDDRPFLRFLWHDPDDVHAVPQVYQFRTLIFGAMDSPIQAISCFQRLVADRR